MSSYLFWASQLGLVCDIIGAILLFKYGLPTKYQETAGSFLVDAASEEDERNVSENNKMIKRRAYMGVILLIAGFVLQLTGNFR